MTLKTTFGRVLHLAVFLSLALTSQSELWAHCDTMDGPVIRDAQIALATGDITPVLKWVRPEGEEEIRRAFEKTCEVRSLNGTARELADRFFFETLVRVHRAGEGAPYTGLKPAGSVDPAVKLADESLETGSPEKLVKVLTQAVEQGIRHHHAEAAKCRNDSARSVEAGRKFVEAYVRYVHFIEGLHQQLTGAGHHHETDAKHGAP